jgi:hypothetical protein
VTFVWLCRAELHSIALHTLDSQSGPRTDTYWANRATLLLKLGVLAFSFVFIFYFFIFIYIGFLLNSRWIVTDSLGSVKEALKSFDEALALRIHPLYYINKARYGCLDSHRLFAHN